MKRAAGQKGGFGWFCLVGMIVLVAVSSCGTNVEQGFEYEGVWGQRGAGGEGTGVEQFLSIGEADPGVYVVVVTSFSESVENARGLGELNGKNELVVSLWGKRWVIAGESAEGRGVVSMRRGWGWRVRARYERVEDIPVEELVWEQGGRVGQE